MRFLLVEAAQVTVWSDQVPSRHHDKRRVGRGSKAHCTVIPGTDDYEIAAVTVD
jgi:hypothetical protein